MTSRHWLGLRRRPGRLALVVFRLPLVLYRRGWGADVDWVRNLRAGPALEVRVGGDRFAPAHRFLTDDEAFDVTEGFRHRHPYRLRLVSRVLGWGDLTGATARRPFVTTHPFVALRVLDEPRRIVSMG